LEISSVSPVDPGLCEALDAVAVTGIVAKTDGHGISINFPPVDQHARNPIEVV
jgi:hypothetical protein